jgi:hypothetical protein
MEGNDYRAHQQDGRPRRRVVKIAEGVLRWGREGNTAAALVPLQALVGAGALGDGCAVVGVSIEAAACTLTAALQGQEHNVGRVTARCTM